MGFYATESACDRPQETYLPPKNRVGGFSATPPTHARLFASQPLETHWENEPTPTTTASGVSFYGYRFYHPELGRWINRDPIGEIGFRSLGKGNRAVMADIQFLPRTLWGLYLFVNNGPINRIDLLGLDCLDSYNMSLGGSGCCSPCQSKPFWDWVGYSSYGDCLWKRTGIPSLETAALGECIAKLGKKKILSIISTFTSPAEVAFQVLLCAMDVCVSPSGVASSNGIRRLRNASRDDWDTTLSEDIVNAIAEKIVEACQIN